MYRSIPMACLTSLSLMGDCLVSADDVLGSHHVGLSSQEVDMAATGELQLCSA
jgi:hypothetical protein